MGRATDDIRAVKYEHRLPNPNRNACNYCGAQ